MVKHESFPVELRINREREKRVIINMATESSTNFGNINLKANMETEDIPSRMDMDKRKDIKREIQVLKLEMECSNKKNKKFSATLPINNSLRKNNSATIHLLLELTPDKKMLTVADDYADARMTIKNSTQSIDELVQNQRKKMDQRRKNSGDHKDPDFEE